MSAEASAVSPVSPAVRSWAGSAMGRDATALRVEPITGDASNRRYYRLSASGAQAVLMEAPPATEKNREFLAVRAALEAAGLRVPALLAADLEQGYLLLEDLGTQVLLQQLRPDSVDDWYRRAGELLLTLARADTAGAGLPDYGRELLDEELGRLPRWFLEALLGLELSSPEHDLLRAVDELLIDSALAQPRVFVHRDFHSRNLMPQPDGQLAVIDFQDAVRGPLTYDLVSLLRDCYIRWPREQVRGWALAQRDAWVAGAGIAPIDDDSFLRWFDLMGLQRHLKVLGTFARLYLRDGKEAYLADLPLVLAYVAQILAERAPESPAIARLWEWWQARVQPVVARQPWYRAP